MDDFWSALDEFSIKKLIKTCCDNSNNHLLGEGMVICKYVITLFLI